MIRLRKSALPVVAYLALTTATTLHAQERIRAGMWENTVISSTGQTSTRSKCVKPAEVATTNGSLATTRAETEKALLKEGCTLKDFKLDGGNITQTMVCGSTNILSVTTFHDGDSVETKMTYTEGGTTGTTQIKGRRTGAC